MHDDIDLVHEVYEGVDILQRFGLSPQFAGIEVAVGMEGGTQRAAQEPTRAGHPYPRSRHGRSPTCPRMGRLVGRRGGRLIGRFLG